MTMECATCHGQCRIEAQKKAEHVFAEGTSEEIRLKGIIVALVCECDPADTVNPTAFVAIDPTVKEDPPVVTLWNEETGRYTPQEPAVTA